MSPRSKMFGLGALSATNQGLLAHLRFALERVDFAGRRDEAARSREETVGTPGAGEKRYARDAHEAVAMEFDQGLTLCRSCVAVIEGKEYGDEGRPLCAECWKEITG